MAPIAKYHEDREDSGRFLTGRQVVITASRTGLIRLRIRACSSPSSHPATKLLVMKPGGNGDLGNLIRH
jgi:hypothetical protein